MPVFFVHGGGGNVIGFGDLVRLLGADQPVYGIQARGLYDDRPPDTNVEEMAAHYVALVRVAWPRGPYALAGYSFGGVVAFEMARQLTASRARVALLALLDAPALGGDRALPKAMQLRRRSSRLGRRITHHARRLLQLRRREKIDYLAGKSRIVTTTVRSRLWRMQFHLWSTLHRLRSPRDLRTGEVLPDHFRNVSESLLLAARRYTPRPYAGSATLFRARDTPAFIQDPTLGWSELVEHLQIREVPGDHDTLLKEPHVLALALELKTCLEAARNAARDNLQTSNPS